MKISFRCDANHAWIARWRSTCGFLLLLFHFMLFIYLAPQSFGFMTTYVTDFIHVIVLLPVRLCCIFYYKLKYVTSVREISHSKKELNMILSRYHYIHTRPYCCFLLGEGRSKILNILHCCERNDWDQYFAGCTIESIACACEVFFFWHLQPQNSAFGIKCQWTLRVLCVVLRNIQKDN